MQRDDVAVKVIRVCFKILGLFAVSLVILAAYVVVHAYFAPSVREAIARNSLSGERADVLFGTATIALTVVGLLLALIGVVGWTSIQSTVERHTRKFLNRERAHERALAQMTTGAVYSSLYENLRFGGDLDMIRELGIESSSRALESKNLRDEKALFACRNNLAYLLAMRQEPPNAVDPEDGARAMTLIEQCQELGVPVGARPQFVATQATVMATFAAVHSRIDRAGLVDIQRRLLALADKGSIGQFQPQEMHRVKRLLEDAIAGFER